jgi:hypothetical protein
VVVPLKRRGRVVRHPDEAEPDCGGGAGLEDATARANVILRRYGIAPELGPNVDAIVALTARILGGRPATSPAVGDIWAGPGSLLAQARQRAATGLPISTPVPAPAAPTEMSITDPLNPVLIEEIAAELEGSLDELIELIFERMTDEIPDYGRLQSRPWKADVEESVRGLALLYINTVREDRRLSPAELAVLRRVGTQRAEQGIGLDALLTALRVAMRVGWEYTVARITRLQSGPEAFRALGHMGLQLLTFIDDVSLSVTDSFLRLQEKAMSASDRTRRSFLQDLLRGDLAAGAEAQTRALGVGFALRDQYRIMVVTCQPQTGSWSRVRDAAAALSTTLVGTFELETIGEHLSHVAVLIPDGRNAENAILDAAKSSLARHGAVAVITHLPAAAGDLPSLYRRLKDLLPIALTVYPAGSLVDEDDVGLYAILSAGPLKERERFVESVMGGVLRLPPAQRQTLLETLVVLHQNSDSLRATAQALHIHPKTVQYRTRRIHELTGLSWSQPGDRLRLDIALHLLRLAERTGENASGSWTAIGPGALHSPTG